MGSEVYEPYEDNYIDDDELEENEEHDINPQAINVLRDVIALFKF